MLTQIFSNNTNQIYKLHKNTNQKLFNPEKTLNKLHVQTTPKSYHYLLILGLQINNILANLQSQRYPNVGICFYNKKFIEILVIIKNNPLMQATSTNFQIQKPQLLDRQCFAKYSHQSSYTRSRPSTGRLYIGNEADQSKQYSSKIQKQQKQIKLQGKDRSLGYKKRCITPQNRRFKYTDSFMEIKKESQDKKITIHDNNYGTRKNKLNDASLASKQIHEKTPSYNLVPEISKCKPKLEQFNYEEAGRKYNFCTGNHYQNRRNLKSITQRLGSLNQIEIESNTLNNGSTKKPQLKQNKPFQTSIQNHYSSIKEQLKKNQIQNPNDDLLERFWIKNRYLQDKDFSTKNKTNDQITSYRSNAESTNQLLRDCYPKNKNKISIQERLQKLEQKLQSNIQKQFTASYKHVETSSEYKNKSISPIDKQMVDFRTYHHIIKQPSCISEYSNNNAPKQTKITWNSTENCCQQITSSKTQPQTQIQRYQFQLKNQDQLKPRKTDRFQQKQNKHSNYQKTKATFSRHLDQYEDEALSKIKTINELNHRIGQRIKNILNNIG